MGRKAKESARPKHECHELLGADTGRHHRLSSEFGGLQATATATTSAPAAGKARRQGCRHKRAVGRGLRSCKTGQSTRLCGGSS